MSPSNVTPRQKVHQDCRRKYCNPQQIAKCTAPAKSACDSAIEQYRLQSTEDQFHFKTDCFFCGQPAMNMTWRKQSDVSSVRTIAFKYSVLDACSKRNDTWASSVWARILAVHDLPAADAIHYKSCIVNFRTMKHIPSAYQADKSKVKRAKMGHPIVIFDGYDSISTKDMTHQRRAKGRIGPTVTFTEDMAITLQKEQFLANSSNRQNFVNMLSSNLVKNNCKIYHASGDADLLIVQKAVK